VPTSASTTTTELNETTSNVDDVVGGGEQEDEEEEEGIAANGGYFPLESRMTLDASLEVTRHCCALAKGNISLPLSPPPTIPSHFADRQRAREMQRSERIRCMTGSKLGVGRAIIFIQGGGGRSIRFARGARRSGESRIVRFRSAAAASPRSFARAREDRIGKARRGGGRAVPRFRVPDLSPVIYAPSSNGCSLLSSTA